MAISKETLELINAFKNPILEILKDIKDEVKFYFDTGIIKYVESIREKFSKTKTFLYRLENVNFYDIYFPITLRHNKQKNYQIEEIENLFENSNFISIIGNAGSGKSMLLKHVFLKSIMQIVKIPIVVELRNLNDFKGTFIDYLNILLVGKKITPNKKILERILSNGEFIFLLDGYDEIYSDNKNKITAELIDFIDNYSSNYFLITSRPGANVESLPRFDNYLVNSLNKNQVEEFIYLQLKQCDDKKLAEKIISVVNKPENQDYNSYLSSPLLLSMFIMTFNSYPELPKSKGKFYWNVYDTLCTKHDAFTKHGGYQHERKTGLQNEDFEQILKWFSFTSLFKGKFSFDNQYFTELLKKIKSKLNLDCNIDNLKEDLTVAISIIIIDGLEYKFPHKSLQEYFSALLIKEQSTETKEDIYKNKFVQFSRHTFDRNDNFWNLCNEIDNVAFTKYFILYYLQEFIDKIDFSNNESICKSFFAWFNFKQGFQHYEKENKFIFNSYQWLGQITVDILEYLEITRLSNIGLMNKLDVSFDLQIEKLIAKGLAIKEKVEKNEVKYLIDYYKMWNDEIYSFIINARIDVEILKITTEVKRKIKLLSNEIEIKEKNKADLLEL